MRAKAERTGWLWASLRALLFLLPPELAHACAGCVLKLLGLLPARRFASSRRNFRLAGFDLASPLGLAAGFDKDAEYLTGLRYLGFAFVEVGSVTPLPQPGNPAPRLFRLPHSAALINRMGFNSQGAAAVGARLRMLRAREKLDFPVGVNLGKNRDTPLERAAEDYVAALRELYSVADYLVVNLSSPNTPNLTALQEGDLLQPLLEAVRKARDEAGRTQGGELRPLFLKISPDLTAAARAKAVGIALASGYAGIIASNTSRRRDFAGLDPRDEGMLAEAGGLSGAPLALEARSLVPELRKLLGKGPILISAGGVTGVEEAEARLALGADLVQAYTPFLYGGPGFPGKFLRKFGGLC